MVDASTVQKVCLRGRAEERDTVAALLDSAAAGHGAALVVAGPAGIGKTALLADTITPAEGHAVLAVTGCPAESALPYAALHRLLAPPGARHHHGLGPARCDGGAPPDRLAAGVAALAALRAIAGRGVLVCLVDDAHALDRPSLEALAIAARRLAAERIAILFALRDAPASATTEAALAGLPRRRLTPLDRRASRDVLADAVPNLAGDVAGVLASLAGGNPRALLELAGALTPEQRRGEAAPPEVPPRDGALRREYRALLRTLPPPTWRMLVLAATAALTAAAADEPAPGCPAALLLAAGHPPADLTPAERAELVHADGTFVRFGPPLLAPVIYAEATLAERHAAHRLLAGGAADLVAALHRAAVAAGPDAGLAADLADAAGHAPPSAASAALQRSAGLTADPVLAAARTLAAARLAWRAGEPHRARLLLRSAFGPAVPQRQHAERELLLGEIELRTGAPVDAAHTLLAAARRLDGGDPSRVLAALALAGEALVAAGRHDRIAEVAVPARHLPAASGGDELLLAYFEGVAAGYAGEPGRAVAPLRRVVALGAAADEPGLVVRAAWAGIQIGQDEAAHRLAVRAARIARGVGDRVSEPLALEAAATAALALGDLDLAVATAEEGRRLAAASAQDAVADNCRGLLAVVAGMRGDAAGCRRWVRACRARAGMDIDSQARAMCVWAAGLVDVAEGRHADAAGRLWGVMRTAVGRGHLGVQVPAIPTLVEAVVRSGDPGPVREVLAAYDVWAASTANPTWLALSARCHGLLAGGDDEADARFREALRLHLAGDSAFARARTGLLYGEELRRRRRPAAAREHLRAALATFEQFGAAPWVRRATAELRAAGDHVAPAARARPALTAQQERIAELVAGGATNREIAAALFVSPRTVDHHLRNIFVRLGVRSRTELARVMT